MREWIGRRVYWLGLRLLGLDPARSVTFQAEPGTTPEALGGWAADTLHGSGRLEECYLPDPCDAAYEVRADAIEAAWDRVLETAEADRFMAAALAEGGCPVAAGGPVDHVHDSPCAAGQTAAGTPDFPVLDQHDDYPRLSPCAAAERAADAVVGLYDAADDMLVLRLPDPAGGAPACVPLPATGPLDAERKVAAARRDVGTAAAHRFARGRRAA